MKRALLERSRAVIITFVCAALVITGCSAPQEQTTSTQDDVVEALEVAGVVEGELTEAGLTLTLDGIVVTVPSEAAPRGTNVRLALESISTAVQADTSPAIRDGDEVVSVSESISITLGDGLQPAAPISIVFPISVAELVAVPDGEAALVMRSVSADGTVSLAGGIIDTSAGTFTTQTEHLSWFQVFNIDLSAAVREAKTALFQGMGLEYPEPNCTKDVARVDGWSYTVPQPPQSWLCVSDQSDALSVKASPNSVIPFVLTSEQASSLRTDLDELSVTKATLVVVARALGYTGPGQAAVMPGTTSTVTFSGTPDEVTIELQQHLALLVMAILVKVIDVVFVWFRVASTLIDTLDGLQCLADLVKVAPPGSTFNGERIAAFTQAFFSCVGTLGKDVLTGVARTLLSVIAATPGIVGGAVFAVLNEVTGHARATVELDVTAPARPVGSSALNLAPSGRVIVNGEEVSALPHQDGVARLTSVLGAPDLNGPLSNVCDNPALGEWSIVGWKNFSVLIQIGDNPYGGGNDRKGRIVGWELTSWTDQRLDPSPSMNGLTLGSTLASARAAIPNAVDGEGDGVWGLYVDRGPDILSGAHLYFLSNSPEAQVIYIGSGLTCS